MPTLPTLGNIDASAAAERDQQFASSTRYAIRTWPKAKLRAMADQYDDAARRAVQAIREVADPKLSFVFQAMAARNAARAHAFRVAAGRVG